MCFETSLIPCRHAESTFFNLLLQFEYQTQTSVAAGHVRYKPKFEILVWNRKACPLQAAINEILSGTGAAAALVKVHSSIIFIKVAPIPFFFSNFRFFLGGWPDISVETNFNILFLKKNVIFWWFVTFFSFFFGSKVPDTVGNTFSRFFQKPCFACWQLGSITIFLVLKQLFVGSVLLK